MFHTNSPIQLLQYCKTIIYPSTALPVPTVTITPSSLMITSGQSSTLTCTVAVVEYLVVVPAVQWMDSNGQEVGGVLNTIGTVTTSVLGFTGLATSQAGPYSCRGSINVPSVVDRDSSDQIVVTAHSKCTIHIVYYLCIPVIVLTLPTPSSTPS